MINIKKTPSENEAQYIWRICSAKDNGTFPNAKWEDVAEIINNELYGENIEAYKGSSAYRKRFQYAKELLENHVFDSPSDDLDKKLNEIRKERMKLQTLNLERTRIDRCEARQELYYEYIGSICNALPWPEFKPLYHSRENNINYVLSLADIHYGATFESTNNSYSPAIACERMEFLLGDVIEFIQSHKVNQISIVGLGDDIQGIIRLSDLKLNDSSVVKAVVDVSHMIANFINQISAYCVVDYYHAPSANHSQLRPLGSKDSEIADEDLEFIIGNYIRDLCVNNDRVHVHLAKDGEQYIDINVPGSVIVAGHGHTIKNISTALRDLSMLQQRDIDYLMLGHFHGSKQFSVNEAFCSDKEVIICPSFCGSDPYADSIFKGSKAAAKIFGFDKISGLVEEYKFVLN